MRQGRTGMNTVGPCWRAGKKDGFSNRGPVSKKIFSELRAVKKSRQGHERGGGGR